MWKVRLSPLMVNEYCDKYCDDILTHVDQPCAAPFTVTSSEREDYSYSNFLNYISEAETKVFRHGCLVR